MLSSYVTFPFSQGLFDLTNNDLHRSAFPFEKAQAMPKPDDFLFSLDVHRR
jgi:hypothetical protein